ncbi:hypothetical protein PXX10_18200 [Vibrio cholerae]|uniref:hypothetical protein n=1 Tax=Vibrio cholerae TaxID=666 RepID=UPI00359DD04C
MLKPENNLEKEAWEINNPAMCSYMLWIGECKNICVSGILNLLKGNTECQYQTNLSISF